MKLLYDSLAPKRSASLSINSDLLDRACALNIDLSSTLEAALELALAKQLRKQWKAENRFAIQAYNNFVEINGCFSDNHRDF